MVLAKKMWISIEPNRGRIDIYPEAAQQRLTQHDWSTPLQLGHTCFNATITLENGIIMQRTPAIPGINGKRAGRRTVINCRTSTIRIFEIPRFGWSFYNNDNSTAIKSMEVAVPIQESGKYVWQWCYQTNLQNAKDNDWIPYPPEVNQSLEQNWNEGATTSIRVEIGIKKLRIEMKPMSTFHKQVDEQTSNMRWVRRFFITDNRIEQIQRALMENVPIDTCAICYTDFQDSPLTPTRTLGCNHVFHQICLQPVLIGNNPKCPMCRVAIPILTSR